MPKKYEDYKQQIKEDISIILSEKNCQPVLFIGSGFSQRYANGPSWEDLLSQLAMDCDEIKYEFAYYKQTYKTLEEIGSEFSKKYKDWAWGAGRENFPTQSFNTSVEHDFYIKYQISEILKKIEIQKHQSDAVTEKISKEIEALKGISPHAIITTNYDDLLENLFPNYEKIIGQQIFSQNYLSIGEIIKIHGCISSPDSIVINKEDYEKFREEKKYLSAKLLTYFVEHPLLFIGYSAQDENIKSILYDVYKMKNPDQDTIPNIYMLEWQQNIDENSSFPYDKAISISTDKNIRIKNIVASDFEWVYNSFGESKPLERIDIKLLRSLLARSVNLIRTDIPKNNVEINFSQLEHAVESGENFANLFGITTLSDPSQINLHYKYVMTDVGKLLGYRSWHNVQKLLDKVKEEKGEDIKATDNNYHIAIKTGSSSNPTHKYSDEIIDLLQKVKNNQDYEVNIKLKSPE